MSNPNTVLVEAVTNFRAHMKIAGVNYSGIPEAPFVAGFGAGVAAARGLSDEELRELLQQAIDYAVTRAQLAAVKVGI